MKFSDVKQYAKKDESATYYVSIHRKLGLILTWLILKVFPNVSVNVVTIMMLPFNVLAVTLLYYAVVTPSFLYLFISFAISFFTFTLDCSDGNIARIKQSSSIKGVYLDRLVHNISHPLFFLVLGFALYATSNQIMYLVIFIIVAILSELSPIDVAQKDVEALFVRQAFTNKTKNYDFTTHQTNEGSMNHKNFFQHKSKLRKILQTTFENDIYYFTILLDMQLFDAFYFTSLFAFMNILARVYIKSNIKQWESNLHEVLGTLYRFKQ